MASKPKPDALQCFNNANSFHEGSIRCGENVIDPATGATVSPSAPTVVNAAFAGELYMKALALRRGADVKDGHNLGWLYNKLLDDAERAAIAEHFKAMTGIAPSHLKDVVERFARAFVEWRYVYEDDARDVDAAALLAFVRSAYLAVRDIAPEWPVTDHLHRRMAARRDLAYVGYTAEGMTADQFLAQFGIVRPHADLTKGNDQNLGLTAPSIDLDGKSASIKSKVDGSADPEDGGTDKGL